MRLFRWSNAGRLISCLTVVAFIHPINEIAFAQSSGLNSTEGSQIAACDGSVGCGSIHTDTFWADSNIHRWKMMNNTNGTSPLIVAQWVCVHPGCIPYSATTQSSGVYTETELLIGAQGTLLTSNGSIPGWSSTPTLGISGTGGTTGQLNFANGNTSGAAVTMQNASATTAYNFNLPSSAGNSGQPLLSGGGGSSAMTFGTLSVAAGGTGRITLTNHGVLVGAGTGNITQLGAAASGTLLGGNGSTSDPSFTAVPTLGVNGTTTGQLGLANGGASGTTVTIQNNAATTAYNFNLPSTAGASGQPLLSGGGSSSPMTYGSVTGNTSSFVTATGSVASSSSGQVISIDSNGNATASGLTNGGAISACYQTSSTVVTNIGSTPANLLSCTIPAGLLNSANRNLHVEAAGVETLGTSGATITVQFQLGSVVICTKGSTSVTTGGDSNFPWRATCDATVVTTDNGTSNATMETAEIFTAPSNAGSAGGTAIAYLTNNTSTVTGIGISGSATLQVQISFSANTNNSASERMLRARVEN